MHQLDANQTHGEKARWRLRKNVSFCFEQILAATIYKTATVWPLTSHLRNHPNEINSLCWELLRMINSLVKFWTPTHGHTSISRTARTYIEQLCADTGCSLEDLIETMDDREWWWERKSQGTTCYRHDFIMIYIYIYIYYIYIYIRVWLKKFSA